ncbi:response regulator [Glycomyces scopariae]
MDQKMQESWKIAIIDDHPSQRFGLENVVATEDDLTVVVAAGTVEEFERRRPDIVDVVVLDLGLPEPGLSGADAVEHLVSRGFRILVVSVSGEKIPVVDAIRAGADGYLTKTAEAEEILKAIRAVAGGSTYYSPTVAGFLLEDKNDLTPRQIEVLRLIASGETAASASEKLFISQRTVEGHVRAIRQKLNANSITDLIWHAIDKGILRRGKSGPQNKPGKGRSR